MHNKHLIFVALTFLSCTKTQNGKAIAHMDDNSGTLLAHRESHAEIIHGVELNDPFRWMENSADPRVTAWNQEQDRFARKTLRSMAGHDTFATRIKELLFIDEKSVPMTRGDRVFYWRKRANEEKTTFYWRKHDSAEEKTLLSPRSLSADGSISIGWLRPSGDGQWAAYTEKRNNADNGTIRVLRVTDGKILTGDSIEDVYIGEFAWAPDNRGFYYVWFPDSDSMPTNARLANAELRYHRLFSDPKTDVVVLEKTGDPAQWIWPEVSEDGRYLTVMVSYGGTEYDVFMKDLTLPSSNLVQIVSREGGEFKVATHGQRILLLTTLAAPRYRILVADSLDSARSGMRELIPERPKVVIRDMRIVGGYIVLQLVRNASSAIEVWNMSGRLVGEIPLPGPGTVDAIEGIPGSDQFYFTFESYNHPTTVFLASAKKLSAVVFSQTNIRVDPDAVVVRQVQYSSHDGTMIPLVLVHKKGLKKTGDWPTLLYAYGAVNISILPAFSTLVLPWVEQGGLYALASVRGGGELGKDWHEAGRGRNKKNGIEDFIAAGEWLIANGYTKPQRLGIRGGSNGGILVGAAMTRRPDLYGAAICKNPLLDMLRFHLFGAGMFSVPEFGNPENKEDFHWLYEYSPYQNVRTGVDYPPLLMLTADSDDRTATMHARKFTAAIQWASRPDGVALLRISRRAGHLGADRRSEKASRIADELTFLNHFLTRQKANQPIAD